LILNERETKKSDKKVNTRKVQKKTLGQKNKARGRAKCEKRSKRLKDQEEQNPISAQQMNVQR